MPVHALLAQLRHHRFHRPVTPDISSWHHAASASNHTQHQLPWGGESNLTSPVKADEQMQYLNASNASGMSPVLAMPPLPASEPPSPLPAPLASPSPSFLPHMAAVAEIPRPPRGASNLDVLPSPIPSPVPAPLASPQPAAAVRKLALSDESQRSPAAARPSPAAARPSPAAERHGVITDDDTPAQVLAPRLHTLPPKED